jgi:hypothetical protein
MRGPDLPRRDGSATSAVEHSFGDRVFRLWHFSDVRVRLVSVRYRGDIGRVPPAGHVAWLTYQNLGDNINIHAFVISALTLFVSASG